MQRLLAFLEQNIHLILFVVLQGLCVFLLFSLNPFQKATFSHTFANVSSSVNKTSSNVTNYLSLKQQNVELQEQSSAFLKNSASYNYHYLRDTFSVNDTAHKTAFDVVPVQVIYNSVHLAENLFVINKGSNHGIEKNMGVVSATGVAGIVLKSNANYSTVMSLLNTNMKLIPRINGQEFFTELIWDNENPNTLRIEGINKLEDLEVGDEITTGTSSLLFPKGVPIGTISRLEDIEGSQYYTIYVNTSTPFRKLEYAFVVINTQVQELEGLLPNE